MVISFGTRTTPDVHHWLKIGSSPLGHAVRTIKCCKVCVGYPVPGAKVMDYGVQYRLFGSTASERVAHWEEKSPSNILDLYAGGRTFWQGNQLEFRGIGSFSGSSPFTAPVIGGRIMAEFLPKWFLLLDGNAGGFGVDNVSFIGSALEAVGYRTTLFGVPSTVQAGYKALTVNVDKPIVAADVTLHGPFIALTGYW